MAMVVINNAFHQCALVCMPHLLSSIQGIESWQWHLKGVKCTPYCVPYMEVKVNGSLCIAVRYNCS